MNRKTERYIIIMTWIILDRSKRRWRKELLPQTEIYKRAGDKVVKLGFTESLIDGLVEGFARLKEIGEAHHVFLTHDSKDVNKHGTVVGLLKDINSRGLPSLFVELEFDDDDKEKTALSLDVSAGLLKDYMDTKGAMHPWVLDHVALTSRPNVPGLEGFVAVAASIDEVLEPPKKAKKMEKLIELLGLNLSADDENLEQVLMDKFEELKKPKEATLEVTTPEIHPAVITLALDARKTKIESLVGSKINAATAKSLIKKHCTEDAVKIDLGRETPVFDAVIDALTENELPAGNRRVDLQRPTDRSGDNVLVADARRLAGVKD